MGWDRGDVWILESVKHVIDEWVPRIRESMDN